ncbi:hypothetical protein F5148DRAFT_328806 [Russula earlei]|uniref:Uncharacterized protein n=1 Tax=Russula earlei TaxID=71964 RepID=A0ACC0UJV9_9AGAM|nr:hypothetical protein F5148DRAFT_328806 [Russula earlei]
MALTPQEASDILAAHLPLPPTEPPTVSFIDPTDADPAAVANFHLYLVHCLPHTTTYLVTLQLSEPLQGEAPLTAPNSIRSQYKFLTALHAHISSGPPPVPLPFPVPIALNVDASRPYILARLPVPLRPSTRLKQFSAIRDALPPEQLASLDLRFGFALRTLHSLQSDWCGPPPLESDGLYNWQEAFAFLMEEALTAAGSAGIVSTVVVTTLRSYLARAIGAFLFEDVEVPSLIALTTGAESVFVAEVNGEPQLALLLPSLAHLLYGDPLLERAFSPSQVPSKALLEGYGQPAPIVFVRQRTKRMWYDLYLGLVVQLGGRTVGDDQGMDWAVQLVEHIRVLLKDAPCY